MAQFDTKGMASLHAKPVMIANTHREELNKVEYSIGFPC